MRIILRFFIYSWLAVLVLVTSYTQSDAGGEEKSAVGQYLAGNYAFMHGDYQKAAEYYSAIPLASVRDDVLFKAYWSLILSDKIDESMAYIRRYYALEPLSSSSRLLLSLQAYHDDAMEQGSTYLLEVDGDEIQQDLSTIDQVIWPYLQIWAHAAVGDMGDAHALIKKLQKKGRHPVYFVQLQRALLYELEGDIKNAKKEYDALYSVQLLPANFIKFMVRFYENNGEATKAEALYQRYQKIHPSLRYIDHRSSKYDNKAKDITHAFAEIYKEASRVLARSELYNEAIVYAYMARYLNPMDHETAFYLGNYYTALEEYPKALGFYNRIKKGSPYFYEVQLRLIRVLFETDKRSQAIKIYRSLQKQYPNSYQFHVMLGDLYRENERFAIAIDYYSKAIDAIKASGGLRKAHWVVVFGRAIAYEQSKQWKEAEADLKKALELNPNQADVLNYLAYGWVERGQNLEKAKAMIEKAMVQKPDDPYIIDSMAWVLYQQGDFKGAVEHLEKAVVMSPYDSDLNHHLGDIYWSLGRFNEARFQWQRALNHNVKDSNVEEIKAKLKSGLSDEPARKHTP